MLVGWWGGSVCVCVCVREREREREREAGDGGRERNLLGPLDSEK